MKITSIKQQAQRQNRYSIFVDGQYSFSLSDGALLESKLVNGQELSPEQLKALKQSSTEDKLYGDTLRYCMLRPHTAWEIETYLVKKAASPTLLRSILNKLSDYDIVNDQKFAMSFIANKRLLRPTSRRKMIMELRHKHVPDSVITQVMGQEEDPASQETSALRQIIERKRRQSRYQDDQKLMQYLARQGFNYDDIKTTLHDIDDTAS